MNNPVSKFIIRPAFGFTGAILGFFIPDAIKRLPGALYRKVVGTYGSEDFVNALIEMEAVSAQSTVEFCYNYFADAVEQAYE